ncbi:EnvZ/OmpR regulon moderator MzrA [Erwinia sp. HR93]|uniref:EnvZ/OmpR regulon moderator MzrA n=1 Tax=Erwinia sp. HR93 TaxID=3094840 RepID=UPI002ADEBB85|nr:EnvZ/OmpR regulon moderator MzrA [Erwinia sp. HR93]MEA1062470.1 EnvZ/OmpR regulon moderator MzrA [Erwinia sp. HR93]
MRSHTHYLRFILLATLLTVTVFLAWSTTPRPEATLEIRAQQAGISTPDGFSVWHHLDANGIAFKSITPVDNGLVITFDSSAQSMAARKVLNRTLPRGYIIAQTEKNSIAHSLMARFRSPQHDLG